MVRHPKGSSPSSEESEEIPESPPTTGGILVETVTEDSSDDGKNVDDVNDAEDSDDDPSESTTDTVGVDNPQAAGPVYYGSDHCQIVMTTKSQGHTLLCGCIATDCRRPCHKGMQGSNLKVAAATWGS